MIVVYYSHRKGKRLVMVKRFIGTSYDCEIRERLVDDEGQFILLSENEWSHESRRAGSLTNVKHWISWGNFSAPGVRR